MDIRKFTEQEIAEINSYVVNQIPQTILPQLFVLSEEPIKKARIFVAIYRIITGVKDFISGQETKEKLKTILKEVEDVYKKLYEVINELDSTEMELKKKNLNRILLNTILDNNSSINSFINSFLVFAEKQELIPVDSVSGVRLDTDEGQDLYKKLVSKV